MGASSFISSRLLRESRTGTLATKIATAGVAVGVFVMLISVSIVLGFQGEIREKMANFSGHLRVVNHEGIYHPAPRSILFDNEEMTWMYRQPHVMDIHRFAVREGMLKTDETFRGIQLKGIAPDSVLYGGSGMSMRISRAIADGMGLKVGDHVFAYFFDGSLKARRFTVVDIYETHLKEFDENVCFCPLSVIQQLNGWSPEEVDGVEVLLDDFTSLGNASQQFKRHFNKKTDKYDRPYVSLSLWDVYPQIFSWLDLLDGNVWAILIIMILVAVTTVVCGLLIIILEQTSLIGLLKALGCSNIQVRGIFLRLSALIVLRALACGNIAALLLICIQRYTGFIHLDADTYYLSEVPMYISVPLFVMIDIGVFVVTTLSLILPSYVVSRISPAQTMRFE